MRLLKFISAMFLIRTKDVCDVSAGMGEYDMHDYPLSVENEPWHFFLLTCKHCGKKFYI